MLWQCVAGPLLVGGVYAGLGGLARAGRLPRNGLAGVRLPSTTASPQAWDAAHRAVGPGLVGTGAASGLLGVVLLVLWLTGARPPAPVLNALTLAWILGLIVATALLAVVADRAARAASYDGRD